MISQINFIVEGLGQFSTYRSGKQDKGWASFYNDEVYWSCDTIDELVGRSYTGFKESFYVETDIILSEEDAKVIWENIIMHYGMME